jgi:hypothetical protein
MRVLRVGAKGDDVEAWQLFLRGQGYFLHAADGSFESHTDRATKAWQKDRGLVDDGVAGPRTFGVAQGLGFNPGFVDDDASERGPNWPPRPAFEPLGAEARARAFGQFQFRPAPVSNNPEAIQILDDWAERNIERVQIPQLVGLDGAPASGAIRLHKLAAEPFRKFFRLVDEAGLGDRVLSFGGSWVPRFVRGSTTTLSNHAYGSAIDINVPWNGLKVVPALKGKRGSVRELVPIANECGLYWGGHFSRADGMHFEVARVS